MTKTASGCVGRRAGLSVISCLLLQNTFTPFTSFLHSPKQKSQNSDWAISQIRCMDTNIESCFGRIIGLHSYKIPMISKVNLYATWDFQRGMVVWENRMFCLWHFITDLIFNMCESPWWLPWRMRDSRCQFLYFSTAFKQKPKELRQNVTNNTLKGVPPLVTILCHVKAGPPWGYFSDLWS